MAKELHGFQHPLSEDDQRQIDLTDHAMNRVEVALRGVTQLMENENEVYALLLSVAGTLVRSAGSVLQRGHEERGIPMPIDIAEKRAVLDLLTGLGLNLDKRKK